MCGRLTSQLQISSVFDISVNDTGKESSYIVAKFLPVRDGIVSSDTNDASLPVRDGIVSSDTNDASLLVRDGVVLPDTNDASLLVRDGVVLPETNDASLLVRDGVVSSNTNDNCDDLARVKVVSSCNDDDVLLLVCVRIDS